MIYDLEVCLSSVFYNTDYIVRMDNLNIDLLISPQDTHAHYLQNIISLCSMKQIIDTPTRITSNCASLLYLIFLFLDLRVLESGVYDEIDVSDHRIIYAYLNIEKSHRPSHKRLCRNLNSISAEALENMIIQIDWSQFYAMNNVDDMVSSFTSNLTNFQLSCVAYVQTLFLEHF